MRLPLAKPGHVLIHVAFYASPILLVLRIAPCFPVHCQLDSCRLHVPNTSMALHWSPWCASAASLP